MKRERIAQAALRVLPPDVRLARGSEMLSTLLDVGATSRARFVREIVGLGRFGLYARQAQRVRVGSVRLVADGVCLAGVWLMALLLTSDIGDVIHGPIPDYPRYLYGAWTLGLLSAALALALLGRDRLAGVTALLFTASILVDPSRYELTNPERVRLIVPIVCFVVLVLYPRERTPNWRRLAWLAPLAALTVVAGISSDAMAVVAAFGLVVLVPTSLPMIRVNPRPTIACAVAVAYFGIHITQDRGGPGLPGLLLLAAVPVVVAYTILLHARTQVRNPSG